MIFRPSSGHLRPSPGRRARPKKVGRWKTNRAGRTFLRDPPMPVMRLLSVSMLDIRRFGMMHLLQIEHDEIGHVTCPSESEKRVSSVAEEVMRFALVLVAVLVLSSFAENVPTSPTAPPHSHHGHVASTSRPSASPLKHGKDEQLGFCLLIAALPWGGLILLVGWMGILLLVRGGGSMSRELTASHR